MRHEGGILLKIKKIAYIQVLNNDQVKLDLPTYELLYKNYFLK